MEHHLRAGHHLMQLAVVIGCLVGAVAVVAIVPTASSRADTNEPAGLASTCDSPLLSFDIPDNFPQGLFHSVGVAEYGTITDLDLCLDVSHTWVGDLVVTLKHNDTGTTATLIDRPGKVNGGAGCPNDDISVVLNDEAGTSAEDVCAAVPPAIGGDLVPNSPLAAFDGEGISGRWTITVSDNAGGDVGTLDRWALIPQVFVPTPQPILGDPAIVFGSNRDDNQEIYVMDEDGGNPANLTVSDIGEWDPAWSPDGSQIAFIRSNPETTGSDIWVMNEDGTGQKRLTTGFSDSGPSWSPDGSKIAFDRDLMNFDSKVQDIWVVNSNGFGEVQLTDRDGSDISPDWSPDGTRILFTGGGGIRTIQPDGQNDQIIIPSGGSTDFGPTWSPDGTMIAFSRGPALDREIYTVEPSGLNLNMLTNTSGNFTPGWSPDGSRIVFGSDRDGDLEIYVMGSGGSNETNLTNNPADIELWPDWRLLAVPTATPGPTPTPSPTPTATPSPTPSSAPGANAIWADDDCNLAVAATDALKKLQDIASIAYNVEPGCPTLGDTVGVQPAGFGQLIWGDTDCDGDYDAVDALQILRHIAGLNPNQNDPCPLVGEAVLIE